ncbi:MAG: zinc ABC transporter substrate-binding protein [Gorillibacterium sp.]|nr:zinc ABC transporter substrate-binding protein [Gorillibacterium sp.]
MGKLTWLAAFAIVILLSGCDSKSAAKPTGSTQSSNPSAAATVGNKLKIVTSFYPMYEFTRQVAGEYADVIALVPQGVEPHDWEPSAKDMTLIQEANVFVYNGIVEGWAEKALDSTTNADRVIVEASNGMDLIVGVEDEEEGNSKGDGTQDDQGLDPHVWLSPVLAQQEVSAIAAALIKADPAHKDDFQKNADAYIAKLKELDASYSEELKNIKRTEFVTQHASFGYLAKQYGLTQMPISGLSPEQEPSPDKMVDIIKFAKEHDVKTIFFETMVDPKIAETIAAEVKAKTDVLNPIEGLTDEDKQNNRDYIAIMYLNLEGLAKALNE